MTDSEERIAVARMCCCQAKIGLTVQSIELIMSSQPIVVVPFLLVGLELCQLYTKRRSKAKIKNFVYKSGHQSVVAPNNAKMRFK